LFISAHFNCCFSWHTTCGKNWWHLYIMTQNWCQMLMAFVHYDTKFVSKVRKRYTLYNFWSFYKWEIPNTNLNFRSKSETWNVFCFSNMKVVGFWILRNFCFDQSLSFNIKILGNLSLICLLHGQLSSSSLPHKWPASMSGSRLLVRAGVEEVLRGPMHGKQA
jgi:hypothetical protein